MRAPRQTDCSESVRRTESPAPSKMRGPSGDSTHLCGNQIVTYADSFVTVPVAGMTPPWI